MSTSSIAPRSADDARVSAGLDAYARRIEATPPGTCPIAVQAALLEAAAAQTCGKCAPCRDGLPQLAKLLHSVGRCEADETTMDQIRMLATFAHDASDCAIGYVAGRVVLDGLEAYASEYEKHIKERFCQKGVGQTLPCETKCPAHVNVPAYIALVGEGDCAGAVNTVRKDNPFPTACAFVCEHPCEAGCRRKLIDAAINIRGIKKYAVDQARADRVPTPAPSAATGRRIAVVGGGPSGLTCTYFLALMGHEVDVFEAKKSFGGMMRYGIPAYRFPRERLDEDVAAILSAGAINAHLGVRIDAAAMEKLSKSHDAVYVAIGADEGKKLDIEGADSRGVASAVELLGSIGDGDYPDFTGKRVVVIGGGNVAMDCARTSVRAGAAEVSIVYRRRIEDMTALDEEIESAIAEGVEMIALESPVRIEADEQGRVRALITQPQMIGPVRGGRPAPLNASKPERRIEADIVLVAVGQAVVVDPFEQFGMTAVRGRFAADDMLAAEGFDNVFTGGDCQTGPATVIRAIAAGKVAARNIDNFLGYDHKLNCGVEAPAPRPNNRTPTGRVSIAERPARERKLDFDAVELEMSAEEAAQECGRCLRCDFFGCGTQVGGRTQYE